MLRHVVLTLFPAMWLSSATGAVAQDQKQPPAPVAVSPVVERTVSAGQTFVGTVEPSKQAVIGSAVDGRVIEFPVNEGDWVPQNGVLAQLLTETLEHELAAAKATLELRKAELKELQAGSRPEEIKQAKARMEQAGALRDQAAREFERVEKLYKDGVALRERYDLAHFTKVRTEQAYQDALQAYNLAVAGPREEKKEQARARVNEQQAIVDRITDQINKHTIISRFPGYVVAEHTEVGQWVQKGDPVAEVVALDKVEIRVSVLESHLPHVQSGIKVRVEVPALSKAVLARLPTDALLGEVEHIVRRGDLRSRTFPVKIRLTNPENPLSQRSGVRGQESDVEDRGSKVEDRDPSSLISHSSSQNTTDDGQRTTDHPPRPPLLGAGMIAHVTLPTGPEITGLLVPKDALVLGGAKPVVYVVEKGRARMVPVEAGVADGTLIQVSGDIKVGDLVVVRGNERLQPGAPVKVIKELPPEYVPQTKASEGR